MQTRAADVTMMTARSRAPVRDQVRAVFGDYLGGQEAVRLNLGCAKNPEPGFLSLDLDPRSEADILHDLEVTPLPFADGTFDCVLGSHVFEHIHAFLPLVADLYRILKPGGWLIAVTPYVSSDDAWDSPHHVRAFSENTWSYVGQALYERTSIPHAGYGAYQGFTYQPWTVERITLVPYPDLVPALAGVRGILGSDRAAQAEFETKKRFLRNTIKEIHAVLRTAVPA